MKPVFQTIAACVVLGVCALLFYFLNLNDISPSDVFGLPKEITRPEIAMSFTDIRIVKKKGNKTVVDMNAERGFLNQKSNTVDLFKLDGGIKNQDGPPVQIQAEQGKYYKGNGTLTLSGDIHATLDTQITLTTDTLQWNSEKRVLSTDDFVTITKDGLYLTGTGLEFLTGQEEITIKKNVSAIFF